MIRSHTAHLQDTFSRKKGQRLGEALVANLDRPPDVCWLFCAPNKGLADLVVGVHEAIEGQPLIGCTTDGEISSAGFTTGSAVIGGLVSDQIVFEVAAVEDIGENCERSGRALAAELSPTVRYIQLFSDGITGDGSALLRGMRTELAGDIPIAGGTSGDAGRFRQTWQFMGREILTNAAVAVGFSGDFHLGTGVDSGWSPIGLPKKVTRAEGNILYELNGESALEVYERFLGRHAKDLPAVGVEYPLGIIDPTQTADSSDAMLLRATMSVDREAGAIRFAGEITEGTMVYLTCGDRSSILDATETAIRHAIDDLGRDSTPVLVFFYSCMARKMLLGLRTREEFARIRHHIAAEVPVIGFYTYGEYCRPCTGAPSAFHNETATISVIGV
ncbi:MAG: FIST N-terminal domain-containing protein [Desulfosarcinaceae bacterium]|nr:FIST N-terminal domain-containing protein [Desulfosarcinaceae bacterium]